MWKHKGCKIALLLVAFSVLFRVIFAIPAFINPYRISRLSTDSLEYIEFAKKIINCEDLPGQLGFFRTPGYPLFLAFFYKLFVNPVGIILFVQILLTSIIILFVWKLPFMNHKSKVIFSILYILNFNIALYAAQIMSDTLFMVIVFLGILSIIYYLNSPTLWQLFPIASSFAVATWIRPIGLYFFPIVSLFLLAKTRKFYQRKKRFCQILLSK